MWKWRRTKAQSRGWPAQILTERAWPKGKGRGVAADNSLERTPQQLSVSADALVHALRVPLHNPDVDAFEQPVQLLDRQHGHVGVAGPDEPIFLRPLEQQPKAVALPPSTLTRLRRWLLNTFAHAANGSSPSACCTSAERPLMLSRKSTGARCR